jgi:hypothetical protein
MANKIQCETHGECQETFVCSHLTEGAAGLGFNRPDPTEESPFPDAWCDNCDVIYQANNGWSDETNGLISVRLLCSGCYERIRIRNSRTDVTFDDLSSLRWKCHSCEEWHTGPCLDFSYNAPIYWSEEDEKANQASLRNVDQSPSTFLDEDLCIINDEDFFVRGILHLPIIGTAETFRWGIWGSLSRENFQKLVSVFDDLERVDLPPMFSWFSNNISEYPDTLNLKMYAHVREPGDRPIFELEPTDHPLSQEYHHGISPERVREIMLRRLRSSE